MYNEFLRTTYDCCLYRNYYDEMSYVVKSLDYNIKLSLDDLPRETSKNLILRYAIFAFNSTDTEALIAPIEYENKTYTLWDYICMHARKEKDTSITNFLYYLDQQEYEMDSFDNDQSLNMLLLDENTKYVQGNLSHIITNYLYDHNAKHTNFIDTIIYHFWEEVEDDFATLVSEKWEEALPPFNHAEVA